MLVMSHNVYADERIDNFSFIDGEFIENTKFVGCDFSDININNITFNACTFTECEFKNAALDTTFFNDCNLISCTLENSSIYDSTFDNCHISMCEFVDMYSMAGVTFIAGRVYRSIFENSGRLNDSIEFNGGALIISCKFIDINMENYKLVKSSLRGCEFNLGILHNMEIGKCTFAWCNFTNCMFDKLLMTDTAFINTRFGYKCSFTKEVKLRGNIVFVDTFIDKGVEIPSEVSSKIKVGPIISGYDQVEPVETPPDKSVQNNESNVFTGLSEAFKALASAHSQDYQDGFTTCPNSSTTYNYYRNANAAYRFFTDGI